MTKVYKRSLRNFLRFKIEFDFDGCGSHAKIFNSAEVIGKISRIDFKSFLLIRKRTLDDFTFIFLNFTPQKRSFQRNRLVLRRTFLQSNRLDVYITFPAAFSLSRLPERTARHTVISFRVATGRSVQRWLAWRWRSLLRTVIAVYRMNYHFRFDYNFRGIRHFENFHFESEQRAKLITLMWTLCLKSSQTKARFSFAFHVLFLHFTAPPFSILFTHNKLLFAWHFKSTFFSPLPAALLAAATNWVMKTFSAENPSRNN